MPRLAEQLLHSGGIHAGADLVEFVPIGFAAEIGVGNGAPFEDMIHFISFLLVSDFIFLAGFVNG